MSDKKPPDIIREFMRKEGFSDRAIDELLEGNAVILNKFLMPTPWPKSFRVEMVYKDGKLQPVDPVKESEGGENETD